MIILSLKKLIKLVATRPSQEGLLLFFSFLSVPPEKVFIYLFIYVFHRPAIYRAFSYYLFYLFIYVPIDQPFTGSHRPAIYRAFIIIIYFIYVPIGQPFTGSHRPTIYRAFSHYLMRGYASRYPLQYKIKPALYMSQLYYSHTCGM